MKITITINMKITEYNTVIRKEFSGSLAAKAIVTISKGPDAFTGAQTYPFTLNQTQDYIVRDMKFLSAKR